MAPQSQWDGKGKGSRLGNLIFVRLITLFGPLPAYLLLVIVAWHYVFFDKKGTNALKIFRTRLGLATNPWHLFRHYYAFGMSLIDRVTHLQLKKSPLHFTLQNQQMVPTLLEAKQGMIIISAHFGNWDIAGNMLAEQYGINIHAVLYDNEKEHIKEVMQNVEKNRRFSTIPIASDGLAMMLPIKEALNKNEIVCFLADRVLNSSSARILFLGKPACFALGPFQIAAITHTPVAPVFMVKQSLYSFKVITYPPILFTDTTRQNRDQIIQQALQTYVTYLEDIVRKYPYQWYNFFDFWA